MQGHLKIVSFVFLASVVLRLAGWAADAFGWVEDRTFLLSAALVYFLGILFPHFAALETRKVDLWYYSLGMLAIVGAFMTASTQRQELPEAKRIDTLSENKISLERELAFVRHAIDQPEEVLAQLQMAAAKLAHDRRSFKWEECVRDFERADPERARRFRFPDPAASQLCDTIQKETQRQFEALDEALSALSRPLKLPERAIAALAALGGYNEAVSIDDIRIPIKDVLQNLAYPGLANVTRSRLQSEIRKHEADIDEARARIEALEKASKARYSKLAEVMQTIWPYVALVALSLKLAKEKHFRWLAARLRWMSSRPTSNDENGVSPAAPIRPFPRHTTFRAARPARHSWLGSRARRRQAASLSFAVAMALIPKKPAERRPIKRRLLYSARPARVDQRLMRAILRTVAKHL